MKPLRSLLIIAVSLAVVGVTAYADIQAPPMMDMGPGRKLGRGISNVLYGITELPTTIIDINEREGNSAALSYGILKGLGRSIFRFGVGWYEIITFPAPTYKSSFRPCYIPVSEPWKLSTFGEFPPELGWESRFAY